MAVPTYSDVQMLKTKLEALATAGSAMATAQSEYDAARAALEAAIQDNDGQPVSTDIGGTEYVAYANANGAVVFGEALRVTGGA